jgi:hypothetical protein
MVRSAVRVIGIVLISIVLAAGPVAQSDFVIHKEGTGFYHRAACPVVKAGVGVLLLSREQADARGWKQHPECDPEKTREDARVAQKRRAAAEFVHVDDSKYYHRNTCRNLHAGSKRVALEEAGKKFWPCPVCKPPVRRKSDGPAVPRRAGW